MPAPVAQEVKDIARSLFENGATPRDISQELGFPPDTIRSWARAGKWVKPDHVQHSPSTNTAAPIPSPAPIAAPIALQDIATKPAIAHPSKSPAVINRSLAIGSPGLQARDRIRDAIASELLSQLTVLQNDPVKDASELRNTRERQGRAAVVKTIADAAGSIFDFQEHTTGMIWAAELAKPAAVKPTSACVIDVPAEVDPHKPLSLQPCQLKDLDIVRNPEQAQGEAVSPGSGAEAPGGPSMLSSQPAGTPDPAEPL